MKITVSFGRIRGLQEARIGAGRKTGPPRAGSPEVTITFDNPLAMLEVLTAERIRLCETARRQAFQSQPGRGAESRPKSVRRDVLRLEAAGVLRLHEQVNPGHGRMRIVEPTAQRFDLIASF